MSIFPFFLLFIVFFIIGIAGIVISILYLLTLSGTLKLCSPQNQKMTPGEVWLVLIPLFGIVWHFVIVGRLADSLAAEFHLRRIPCDEQRPGYNTGLWALILSLIPVASIVGLVMWIMYWMKISEYKKKLEQSPFQFGAGNPYPYPNQTQNPYQNQNQNPYPYQDQNPNQYR